MLLLPMLASADDSGSCGDNLTWTYVESTKTLTISGSGMMYNYSNNNHAPWFGYKEGISKVKVAFGVTSIGNSAFYGCSRPTSISLPDCLTCIGDSAFYGCSSLTSINIPIGVVSIGSSAFARCSSLPSISIPNGVTSINKATFFDCYYLTSVTIPNSVTCIDEYAFAGCNRLTSVTMGNGVTSIGKGAFNCPFLNKIIVKDIAAWCRIKFETEDSNPLLYARHIYSDENSEIKDLVIPDGVTSINEYAFYGCSGLTSVTIGKNVTAIGERAFASCKGLTSVTIGNNVTNIGGYAFFNCNALTSVVVGNSVTSISEYAFYDCSNLKKVIVNDIATWCNIEFGAYYSNPLFYAHHIYSDENTEIQYLVIPDGVTKIGYGVFAQCSGLISVTIPNSVTSIGDGAFARCEGLTSVTIGNNVTRIGSGAFSSCSFTSVTIPNSVMSIGKTAFLCDNLATVVSLIETPFKISGVFTKNTLMNGILYIPAGTKDVYEVTLGWENFVNILEGTGGSTPVIPETKKCEKPTVSYRNGKLTFSSGTEGATCVSSITDADMGTYTTNEVQLGVTYNISVYAAKAGYENSETVAATLCWIDQEPKTEGITSGVASVKANAVLMQSEAGVLSIQGVDDGTPVSVYTVNGTEAGSAVSNGGQAQVNTNLQPGTVAIVKIGEKSVKVVVK